MFGLLRKTLFFSALAMIAVPLAWTRIGLRLNSSPSLPLGLYRTAATGNLVEFCPSGLYSILSAIRGYRGPGVCIDGAMPLLKPIAGRPGDIVTVTREGTTVNGRLVPNTKALKIDSKGRALYGWPRGIYQVRPGQLWVLSSYSYRSFDSRYYGPIKASQVRAHVVPVIVQWW